MTRKSTDFSSLLLSRHLSFLHSWFVSVASLAAFYYCRLYHGTESPELKSSSSYASHCTNTQQEKGCSKSNHGRAGSEGREGAKDLCARSPSMPRANRSLLWRSDPWPPANGHFLLLDDQYPIFWCILGGLSHVLNVAGHTSGAGCSCRITQGGAGASLPSRAQRAQSPSGGNHTGESPPFPRAIILLWGHSLPCKTSSPLSCILHDSRQPLRVLWKSEVVT